MRPIDLQHLQQRASGAQRQAPQPPHMECAHVVQPASRPPPMGHLFTEARNSALQSVCQLQQAHFVHPLLVTPRLVTFRNPHV